MDSRQDRPVIDFYDLANNPASTHVVPIQITDTPTVYTNTLHQQSAQSTTTMSATQK
jgi:hypothetical protein